MRHLLDPPRMCTYKQRRSAKRDFAHIDSTYKSLDFDHSEVSDLFVILLQLSHTLLYESNQRVRTQVETF